MIETQLLKLQLHQVELVAKIGEAEKVANMAQSLDLMGPAGRRLYGAVKGLFEKVNTVVMQRAQLEGVVGKEWGLAFSAFLIELEGILYECICVQ